VNTAINKMARPPSANGTTQVTDLGYLNCYALPGPFSTFCTRKSRT
jgi:hypothetical protein